MIQPVVVGIIINAEQQILVAQRLSHQVKPGLWEFPGGKIEPDETAFAALQREYKEEIDIEVVQAEAWLKFDFKYPHKHVLLDIWLIKEFNGIPRGAEGQPIRWVRFDELCELDFPGGNKIIIENLREYFF